VQAIRSFKDSEEARIESCGTSLLTLASEA
jgi:hypothetical protein